MQSDKRHHVAWGDFNLPDIDWESVSVKPGARYGQVNHELTDMINDNGLKQHVNFPTRDDSVLDLFISNTPSLIDRIEPLPGISDHDMVYIETTLKPCTVKQPKRKIFLYKRADWDSFKSDVDRFACDFGSIDHSSDSVTDMWSSLESFLNQLMERYIPNKMSSHKNHLPFMTHDLKRLMKQRDKWYSKNKKHPSDHTKQRFKDLKAQVQRETRAAYWKYVADIITDPDSSSESTPKPNKRFWAFIKGIRQDSCGVSPLLSDGEYVSDSARKAEILNQQYTSVFTVEDTQNMPVLGASPFNDMPRIQIDANGVTKLLTGLNPNKASGPDGIPARVLKETASVISPILTIIFQKSLDLGEVPQCWKDANVAPVFKKGEKYKASNYRPVSLTCITAKILEHIIVSNIMKHLEVNQILVDSQHGFRNKRSCETQLVEFVQELTNNTAEGLQTDVIVMDFSKAFDKVPHRRLSQKISHYGIRGSTLSWIENFLCNRKQKVVVDGEASTYASVTSGVPQGTVLGPVLFLMYINDLPDGLSSHTRLFADDCVVYRSITEESDSSSLQHDLDKLGEWETKWQMKFNIAKCHTLRISKSRHPIDTSYSLHGSPLGAVSEADYLGVKLTSNLTWTPHINRTVARANQALGFIRRNLRSAPHPLRQSAYFALVRPRLEYSSTVWSPYTQTDKHRVEKVQRRAARFVTGRFRNKSSVTDMLTQLGWDSLEERRLKARATLTYKIRNGLVAIPAAPYLCSVPVQRHTRHAHAYSIPVRHARTDYIRFSFYYHAPAIWNCIPVNVLMAPSIDCFKSRLSKLSLCEMM